MVTLQGRAHMVQFPVFSLNPGLSLAAAASWRASGGLGLPDAESAFAGDAMICHLRENENRVPRPQSTQIRSFTWGKQRDVLGIGRWKTLSHRAPRLAVGAASVAERPNVPRQHLC